MAKLIVTQPDGSDKEVALGAETIRVGRDKENEVAIDDGSVSTFHAEIRAEKGAHHVHDLGSTNGIRVNGERVTESPLGDGDLLRFGNIKARYEGDPGPEVRATGGQEPAALPGDTPAKASPAADTDAEEAAHHAHGPLAPGHALPGFGPPAKARDPEKALLLLVAFLVVATCLTAVGMSFAMSAG